MSSLEIAELVGSRHDHVRNSIERLVKKGIIQSPSMRNFKNINNVDVICYAITKRDSYVVVAQLSPEFTGRLVDRWQELENKEQQRLQSSQSRSELRGDYRPMTDALVQSLDGKEIHPYHFSNEADMLNRITLGYTASGFREFHDIDKKASIRDYFTELQKKCMISLQRANTVYLEDSLNFEERKAKLKALFDRRYRLPLIEEVHLLNA